MKLLKEIENYIGILDDIRNNTNNKQEIKALSFAMTVMCYELKRQRDKNNIKEENK